VQAEEVGFGGDIFVGFGGVEQLFGGVFDGFGGEVSLVGG
jgi:hypothetical protein